MSILNYLKRMEAQVNPFDNGAAFYQSQNQPAVPEVGRQLPYQPLPQLGPMMKKQPMAQQMAQQHGVVPMAQPQAPPQAPVPLQGGQPQQLQVGQVEYHPAVGFHLRVL